MQIMERPCPIKGVSERQRVCCHAIYLWTRRFGTRKHARSGMLSPAGFERRRKMRLDGVWETASYSNACRG